MGFCPFGTNARNEHWLEMGWIKVECQSVIKTMVERRPLIMITTPAASTRNKWCLFTYRWFVFWSFERINFDPFFIYQKTVSRLNTFSTKNLVIIISYNYHFIRMYWCRFHPKNFMMWFIIILSRSWFPHLLKCTQKKMKKWTN